MRSQVPISGGKRFIRNAVFIYSSDRLPTVEALLLMCKGRLPACSPTAHSTTVSLRLRMRDNFLARSGFGSTAITCAPISNHRFGIFANVRANVEYQRAGRN